MAGRCRVVVPCSPSPGCCWQSARARVQLDAVLLATITSVAVGLIFGMYPAIRASPQLMRPVRAYGQRWQRQGCT
jgi:hypothetical protein